MRNVLQKQLYEIGVDLEMISLAPAEVGKRLDAGDFETRAHSANDWPIAVVDVFDLSLQREPSGYSAADKVLDRLRETTNENEIRAAVSDLQQIFHDDPPAIFIAWPKVARVVSTSIKVPEDPDREIASKGAGRDILSSMWQWRPAERSEMTRITSRFVLLIASAAVAPLVVFGVVSIFSLQNGTVTSVDPGQSAGRRTSRRTDRPVHCDTTRVS